MTSREVVSGAVRKLVFDVDKVASIMGTLGLVGDHGGGAASLLGEQDFPLYRVGC